MSKTYVVSAESRGGATKKKRILKRIYKCKKAADLKKTIVMLCVPRRNATGKSSFNETDKHAFLSYSFENGERMIPPSPKSRIFPSVRQELKHKIKQGKPPKKAIHEVLKRKGGIENVPSGSHVANINQSYEISRQLNKGKTDTLKKLIEKQQRDGSTEDTIIQRIQTNEFSYDIILFNQRVINNIADFCCTSDGNYKSALFWDFTFDLGKSPPYCVLALSFQNTILLNKATKKCPVMLGTVLICPRKDENTVKLLCDRLLDACPGLEENIKVLGTDGENGIINQACNAFPYAMLLVCIKHIEENIKRNLPKNTTETKKKKKFWFIFLVTIRRKG